MWSAWTAANCRADGAIEEVKKVRVERDHFLNAISYFLNSSNVWTKRPERSFGSNQVLFGGMI